MCLEMPTVLPTTFTMTRDVAVPVLAETVIMRSVAVPVSMATIRVIVTRLRPTQKEQTLEGVTRSRDYDKRARRFDILTALPR
jgi:hypothetical protein